MNKNSLNQHSLLNQNGIMLPAIAVILLQYINIGRPQDILYFIRYSHPGVLSFGLMFIACLIYWNKVSGPSIFRSIEFKRFRNIVILMVLLVPFIMFPGKSVYFFKEEFFIKIFFLISFFHFIRTYRQLRLSLLVMILSSFGLSISVIMGISLGGRFSAGTMYDPNDIALLFVSLLPVSIYFSRYTKGSLRIFAIITVVLSLVGIIQTQSRGGFIGLISILIVWIFLKSGYKILKKDRKKVIFIAILIIIFMLFAGTQFWGRINTMFDEGAAGSGRRTIWPRCLQMMVWHPLGVGIGSFTRVYGEHMRAGDFPETKDLVRNVAWATAHNSYLLVGVELGFLGLIMYIIWLFGMQRSLYRMKRMIKQLQLPEQLYWHCSMVQLSLIGFMVPAFFLSQSFSPILLSLAGYVIVLKRIIDNEVHQLSYPGEKTY